MRIVLSVLLVLVVLLGALGLEYRSGVDTLTEEMARNEQRFTYHTSLMSARSCVIAMDSAFMRFIVEGGDASNIKELRDRNARCERLWELTAGSSLDEGNAAQISTLDTAYLEFFVWRHQLTNVIKIKLALERDKYLGISNPDLWERMLFEMYLMRNYRDKIEKLIYEAWD